MRMKERNRRQRCKFEFRKDALTTFTIFHMEYGIWEKDSPFILLFLHCPLFLSPPLLSISLSLCLHFPYPYSGRPSSPINSHHHPQVRLRRINHTISESELNSMSKYGGWIMKRSVRVRCVIRQKREISSYIKLLWKFWWQLTWCFAPKFD